MNKVLSVSLILGLLFAPLARATEVMFFVDAEDYTSSSSADALGEVAKIFTESEVRAQFNVVGYLARQLRQQGRNDVFKSLNRHFIGSHTLYLAKRPTVAEYTDIADASEAYRLVMAEESLALGLIKSAFGLRQIDLYAPALADSYVAMYAAADAGMTFCVGSKFASAVTNLPSRTAATRFWYCGMMQLPLLEEREFKLLDLMAASPEPDFPTLLDRLATREFVGLKLETSLLANQQSWLKVNFDPKKPVAFGEWRSNRRRPAAEVQRFYARLRSFIAALKADPRFRLVSLVDYESAKAPRRMVRRSDVPDIRNQLSEKFAPIADLDLSLADVYQVCVEFLRGGETFTPGQVRGFLAEPRGVAAPTEVTAADMRSAARRLVDVDYIPAQLRVGDKMLGPADFVMAALEILETQADKVTVKPRDQWGAWKLPKSADKSDRFLSERLRLQAWTYRRTDSLRF